jgi:predicted ATPase
VRDIFWTDGEVRAEKIRRADPIGADPHLTTQGGHLHATLYRVGNTPTSDNLETEQIYGLIETNLGRLLSIRELDVDLDPMRKLLMTQIKQRFGGGTVPARSLSDGTLRFLALALLRGYRKTNTVRRRPPLTPQPPSPQGPQGRGGLSDT